MRRTERKILAVTFIPLIVWFIAIFFYYSEILARTSFSLWAFAVVTLPLCVGSMLICYVIMVSREVDRQSVWKWDMEEQKEG